MNDSSGHSNPDKPKSGKNSGNSAEGSFVGKAVKYANLATMFISLFAGPALVGYFIDENAGTKPYGVMVGSLVGLAMALWMVYREIEKMSGD